MKEEKSRKRNTTRLSFFLTLFPPPACFDGIFGMSLEKIAELTGELIPNIVSDTINFLIHSGLARCGIFRYFFSQNIQDKK